MSLTWTQVQARIERAREGLAKGSYTIQLTGDKAGTARFEVEYKDKSYVVTFGKKAKTGKCSCPDFKDTRGPACKHTAMVVLAQWPSKFDEWCGQVRASCAAGPEPEASPNTAPPAERVEALIRQAVHDALSEMEEQLVAALIPEVHATVEDLLVG